MKPLTMTDPKTKSTDLLTDNIEQLKALFPEAFTEGKIDFDAFKQLLGASVDEREEKYDLNWHGKRRARRLALTPSTGTLRPCPEESVDWDTTRNLMIEGDNLEVLTLLQRSYAGKVKLIYIDPPYNTGNDFIYPDNFQDNIRNYLELTGQVDGAGRKLSSNTEASGRFHTDWLNMMYPRLKLARNLLRDDGTIFISIDDNEFDNLRKLCDEVFGPENFVATVIWQKVFSPKDTAAYFSEDHDYILIYAKQKGVWEPELLPRSEDNVARYTNPDNDPRGPWMSGAIQARIYYSKGQYEVTSPSGRKFSNPKGTYWRFSRERFQGLVNDNRIWWGEAGDGVPRFKRFMSEVKSGVVPQTLWKYEDVGHTQEAKEELLKYVEFENSENVLNSVKPTRLLRKTLHIGTSAESQDLVLDFFAGSGTTGHAVLAQNAEDGGTRRFILVQLPEALPHPERTAITIADLTKSRIRNVAKELAKDAAGSLQLEEHGTRDFGFRVYKLDSSNIRAWEPDCENLAQTLEASVEHLKTDRTEADILFEVLLKHGIDLCVPIEKRVFDFGLKIADLKTANRKSAIKNPKSTHTVHSIGGGVLTVCLSKTITREEVEPLAFGMAEWHKALAPAGDASVFFRDSAFADDVAKSNLTAILVQQGFDEGKIKSL